MSIICDIILRKGDRYDNKKIRVDGYKNILDTTLEFYDIVAIVGLNNYGKSNVLDSIDFAQDFIKNPSKIKAAMMCSADRIPINIQTANRNFEFEIEYLTQFEKDEVLVNYMFSFEWVKENSRGGKIVSEVLKVKENDKGKKFNTYINRDLSRKFYKPSETARCDKNIKIEQNELIINKLANYDDLYYLDIINELNEINFDLNVFLDTSSTFDFMPFEMKFENPYHLDKRFGNNVAKLILSLKDEHPDKYELLINSFKSLFPNIEFIEPLSHEFEMKTKNDENFAFDDEEVPFKVSEKIYRIMVKEKTNNQPTDFKNLSNGTVRVFLLLTSTIFADIRKVSLIAFEELENCIHPYLFQQFLIILTEIIRDCRIIITSHSPYLIQYLDLDKIYIGIPSTNGAATFGKAKKSMHNIIYRSAEEQNVTIGDYIFDLLVDSHRDNSRIHSFLEN